MYAGGFFFPSYFFHRLADPTRIPFNEPKHFTVKGGRVERERDNRVTKGRSGCWATAEPPHSTQKKKKRRTQRAQKPRSFWPDPTRRSSGPELRVLYIQDTHTYIHTRTHTCTCTTSFFLLILLHTHEDEGKKKIGSRHHLA